MFPNLVVQNPKNVASNRLGRASWYPYYAGFSHNFAHTLLASTKLPSDAVIIDPWNGSGTTTAAAIELGYSAHGYDLNPVMTIVAKARTLCKREKSSLWPIAVDIVNKAKNTDFQVVANDPLLTWLDSDSAAGLRKIEKVLQSLLVDHGTYKLLTENERINSLSDLAAFFYTALFRSVRVILRPFFTSNPTWVKRPKDSETRLRQPLGAILDIFAAEVRFMIAAIEQETINEQRTNGTARIKVASSDAIPVADTFVDFALTSPPYCTRIDYAVATMLELAILGFEYRGNFQTLRKNLIGTSTVPESVADPSIKWGPTCNAFLKNLASHKSKASYTYYYKNHVQYFDAIYRSLAELQRILKPRGACAIVVQDSFYKELHNDLPQIFIEMTKANNLILKQRVDFGLRRTMAGINPAVRQYRQGFGATESVLYFTKQPSKRG